MKSKYFNLFWAFVASVIILNEFIDQSNFVSLDSKSSNAWLLIIIWSFIAIKNYYSFFSKANKKLNQN